MKTGLQKTGLQSAWLLALSLGVLLAAQAQPADSTGAGRAISAQGTISSSTATTGTYTPTPAPVAPTPAPPPAPVNRPWTLSFIGQTRCSTDGYNHCATIDSNGAINGRRPVNTEAIAFSSGTFPYSVMERISGRNGGCNTQTTYRGQNITASLNGGGDWGVDPVDTGTSCYDYYGPGF
jgi:hypothetical protein